MPTSGTKTNEWEFQGEVLKWLDAELQRRKGMGLERVTQEPSKITPKRSDLVVWINRTGQAAFLAFELKTPKTSISDPNLLIDAEKKAKAWGAPFFAIWNMQAAELYRTPLPSMSVTPADRLYQWPADPLVGSVEDWLKPKVAVLLRKRVLDIQDKAWMIHAGGAGAITIDASVFVDRLGHRLREIRALILPELTARMKADRSLRKKLRALAAAQGFLGFVDDINLAIAGQYTYRLVGQILFYCALRRRQPSLPALTMSPTDQAPTSLRPYWDQARSFDYEALFQPSLLDSLVPVSGAAQVIIRQLIKELTAYDWNSLRDDVLGAVFENLIPKEEQILLGQFYTPSRVADLLISFAVDIDGPMVLDPGCGSGTFLMRAYEFIKDGTREGHAELLSKIWGFDISPFAAELAAINLFRQDMSSFNNFPRIVPGDFFARRAGEEIPFPPAKTGGAEKVMISVPTFGAIVGNPPYLRSQNQDDLELDYKKALFNTAAKNSVDAATKTDLFAFFVYKALEFMHPGSRLAFVTTASWLTADFGIPLQKLLLERLKLVALIASSAESFFSQVDVNTVLLVAERRADGGPHDDEVLRFVTLKRRLDEIFPVGPKYWEALVAFVDRVELATTSVDSEEFRLKIVSASSEKSALVNNPNRSRNWSLFLRAPLSYFEVFGEPK